MEYGAKGKSDNSPGGKLSQCCTSDRLIGDSVTNDTVAINNAISNSSRCGQDYGSSTIYPAFVYFPPGTYLVSSPIIQYYNTELYGDVSYRVISARYRMLTLSAFELSHNPSCIELCRPWCYHKRCLYRSHNGMVSLNSPASRNFTSNITEIRYINTNNFLRSIKNFRMDITLTDPTAYVCAIHWQVA